MAKKSKLRAMAEAGDRWAIETLAKARAQGRAAGRHGAAMRRGEATAKPRDPAFSQALLDAEDIRQWTDGPKPAWWRIYRLAQALIGGGG
jgi:hypothetical protein